MAFGLQVVFLKFKNFHFTSITQKAHGIYIPVLEGADVAVIWSNVIEETGDPKGKPPILGGRPLPSHMV